MAKQSESSGQYRFRRHDSLGAAAAEEDENFLHDCFEDNGDIKVLLDCSNPKRIVLGRTGAGKTALLMELANRSKFVISIKPEDLSFNYLINSTILPCLTDLGINLDPFYKLLWRHVLAVTIIQNLDIVDKNSQNSFIEQVRQRFASKESRAEKKQKAKQSLKALAYLNKWGGRFFEDVESRTKEVTSRFEKEVEKGTGLTLGGNASLLMGPNSPSAGVKRSSSNSSRDSETVEIKEEVFRHTQKVVSTIQVQQLNGILELLEELLVDSQKPCYITIDKLDEPWADNDLRLSLLKGLLDTVGEFGKVHNAKVIICLRVDLVEQLFRIMRIESGFQEDKYRSLYLPLRWNKQQLVELLDQRVGHLFHDTYTNYRPKLKDIVPEQIKFGRRRQYDTIDYILDRTWGRPRDAIQFLNICIQKSEGKGSISKDSILDAEGEYSRVMLRAIATEWYGQYPHLPDSLKALLSNLSPQFKLVTITDSLLDAWSLKIACLDKDRYGELHQLATDYQENRILEAELRRHIAAILYKTGCIGLKISASTKTRWATSESYSISSAEIDDETSISIHPGLWKVLGVNEN